MSHPHTTRYPDTRHASVIAHSKPWVTSSDIRAVSLEMKRGHLSQTDVVDRFESKIARTVGMSGAVATSSGTAALYLTLRALGIGPKDQVLMPSYVCAALHHAVTAVGATVSLVETDPQTLNLDADDARKRIRRRTKVMIVPHLFGQPADLDELLALGPPVIEDCAQTLGVRYRARNVGSFGVASICSFYATKLITSAEGGAVASSSSRLLRRVRQSRAYDEETALEPSFNFKLSSLHAALGLNQLQRLPRVLAIRRRLARRYDRAFASLDLKRPDRRPDRDHGYYRYVIQLSGGAHRLMAGLLRQGIISRRPIFRPLHRYLGVGGFSVTDKIWREAVSLPIYPVLTDREIQRITAAVRRELMSC